MWKILLARTWHCPFALLHHGLNGFYDTRVGCTNILHRQILEWSCFLDVSQSCLELLQFDVDFGFRLLGLLDLR